MHVLRGKARASPPHNREENEIGRKEKRRGQELRNPPVTASVINEEDGEEGAAEGAEG